MKLRFQFICVLIAVYAVLYLVSCKKDDSGDGKLRINLTDGPGDYQEVNIDIQQVRIQMEDEKWQDLDTKKGVYNLLDLQNGVDTTIVDLSTVKSGKIVQMRLVLGSNNTVMKDSVVHDLKVPSGMQSGIKIVGDMEVKPNQTVNILLDFDAGKSVVEQGNGNFSLKPVIKLVK